MLLVFADMVAVLLEKEELPSAILHQEYLDRADEDWNEWVVDARLTGITRLDQMIGTLGKKSAKLYKPFQMDLLLILTSKVLNSDF